MTVYLDNASTTGRPSYSQTNDTTEQTVFTSTKTVPRMIQVYLDVTTLTQNSTVRLYVRTDGTNYISCDTNDGRLPYAFTVASDADNITIGPYVVGDAFRVTIQAGALEGAARAIPYHVIEHLLS